MLKRIVSLCLVLCLMVTALPLNARAAGTLESMNVTDTVVDYGLTVNDLNNAVRAYDYDVPENGATVLVFFSAYCGNCSAFFSRLSQAEWADDSNINIMAVESYCGNVSDLRNFINENAPGSYEYIDYCYDSSGGNIMGQYFLRTMEGNTIYWPLVLIATEENGEKTIRSAGMGIYYPSDIREALDQIIGPVEEDRDDVVDENGVTGTMAKNAASGLEPQYTNNLNANTYDVRATPVRSLLTYEQGRYTRVEQYDESVIIEQYDNSFTLLSQKEIPMELPTYGGAYMCDDYNFLVFGKGNPDEDDEVEVVRVVRYSKDWERQSSASLYGENTTIPFRAGSLRMARSGNKLYIRTSHQMYTARDGLNHQASLMFALNIDEMVVTDCFSRVANVGVGYVSHSFNQFIMVDGMDLMYADHGDAYPRSVVLFRERGSIGQPYMTGSVSHVDVLPISGTTGDNYTGVQLGGLECSDSHYLVTGTSYDQSSFSYDGQQNVFVTATAKDNFSEAGTELIYITGYPEGSDVNVGNPHLVKVDSNAFCLMWMVNGRLNFCMLDGTGRPTTAVKSAAANLSDCAPIVVDGKITWYVTGPNSYTNSVPIFYQLDPNWDGSGSEQEPEQPGHTHSYTPLVTQPTCTEGGYTTYSCSCGDSYIGENTNPLGHNYTTTETPATCTENGSRVTACTNCGLSDTTAILALGHDWDDGRLVREPSRQQDGLRVYTCNRCNLTDEQTIPYVPAAGVTRISGSNRCETAIAVADMLKAELGVEKFSTIIIANGNDFADALAGSYLAAVKNAPILLHRNGSMAANVEYIRNNLASGGTVYILGGEAAVPENFVDAVIDGLLDRMISFTVYRLSGNNRFETNAMILEEGGFTGGEILVCNSHNFADALAASATGLPILLVNNNRNELLAIQKNVLRSVPGVNITIVGGPSAVNEALAAELASFGPVTRIAGSNREATSVEVAKRYFGNPEQVLLAYSRNFPDGLCGGPLAYAMGAPLLLTNARAEAVGAEYVAANGIAAGVVLGGPSVLSDDTARKIFGLADNTPIPMQ